MTSYTQPNIIVELWAPKQSTIIIETEPHVCIQMGTHATLFCIVNMSSGMDHGRMRPTMMMTSCNMAANTIKSCSLGLQHNYF